jgi:membrane protein
MATSEDHQVRDRLPGEEAGNPAQIPPKGWWQVVRRAMKESTADNVPMLAGGVAFFAFLAIFPAIIACITLYGLVADPETVATQVRDLAAILPQQAQPIVADQLQSVSSSSAGALGFGLVVSLLAALWSASSGTGNLIKAVNLAYDEDETRGFLKVRGLALLLTLGAIVFLLLTLALVAVVPVALNALALGPAGTVITQIVRWVLLVVVIVVALAVVYRLAPDRDAPRFAWVSTGSLVAALLWIAGSVVFSLYVNNFGSYNKTYGTIAGVVVLMLWLYLTSYIVLLGAEINAESERQTLHDTTTGEPAPMGERGAAAADEVATSEPR